MGSVQADWVLVGSCGFLWGVVGVQADWVLVGSGGFWWGAFSPLEPIRTYRFFSAFGAFGAFGSFAPFGSFAAFGSFGAFAAFAPLTEMNCRGRIKILNILPLPLDKGAFLLYICSSFIQHKSYLRACVSVSPYTTHSILYILLLIY